MSIFKVAKMFQRKLAVASNSNFQGLKSIYDAAMALTSPNIKNLWLTSESDVDSPYETNIGDLLDNVRSVASRAYAQVMEQGMPAGGQWGYSSFLTNMENALKPLSAWRPSKPLDPSASDKSAALQSAVKAARSGYSPIGIPAQSPSTMTMPQDTINAQPPGAGGAALQGEPGGASPEELSDVVNSLTGDPKQPWQLHPDQVNSMTPSE